MDYRKLKSGSDVRGVAVERWALLLPCGRHNSAVKMLHRSALRWAATAVFPGLI